MRNGILILAAAVATTALGATACSGSSEEVTGVRADRIVARPAARLFLTDAVMTRLKARAAAGDAGWTALKSQCDGWANGTMNPPSGNAYPNFPDVGPGYQGEDYLPAVFGLGLCYRVTADTNPTAAQSYGAAGDRLIAAMATPAGSGGQDPATDSGYGIRNFGVGLAFGYDWLYPALSAGTRSAAISTLNTWIDWYDTNGFSHDQPIGNYFAGYVFAKTAASIATEGDNPNATTYWSDVQNHLYAQLVKPAFQKSMAGGGWPEGWEYGPRAVRSVAEMIWAVQTGKGVDWSADIPQVRDQANYVSYFAWPSLNHMDDQGTVRAGTSMKPSAQLATGLASILDYMGDPAAATAKGFANDVLATSGDDRQGWQKFLYGDTANGAAGYTSRPLSYQATGPGHVAMRSSWDKTATLGVLASGTYIDAPDSGEQGFNEGSLTVVSGDDPILVNATGWIPQVAGSSGEDFVYNDVWGTKERKLYNTFLVSNASNPYSPGQGGMSPTDATTHVERYDEQGGFVRARAANVEQMYKNGAVTQFTRDVVMVRPGTFVVYDRTSVASGGSDQWMAFHVPSAPVPGTTADATQHRLDVQKNGATIGSVRTLLPKDARIATTSLPGGVTAIESHASSGNAQEDWLTTISATNTVAEETRLSAADGNVLDGGSLVGVHVQGARNQVVLFNSDHSGNGTTTTAHYTVNQTADADHVLVDMAPSASGYSVTATASGSSITVTVAPGGTFQLTPGGSLAFSVSATGSVAGAPVQAAPPPSSGTGSTGTGSTGTGSTGTGSTGSTGTGSTGTGSTGSGSASQPTSGTIGGLNDQQPTATITGTTGTGSTGTGTGTGSTGGTDTNGGGNTVRMPNDVGTAASRAWRELLMKLGI